MKAEDILCFRCTHYNPSVCTTYDIGKHVSDKWIEEPCDYSNYLCLECRDFKEIKDES